MQLLNSIWKTSVMCTVVTMLVCSVKVGLIEGLSEFHVDTSSGQIVDSRGRERIFHGLNVVMKDTPWHPRTDTFDPQLSFADADIANLLDLGLNVVRLGVMWPGVEPQRGQVNQTYIRIMQSIVQKLHAAGIVTLLEFHQDLFASRFCGEGVPSWVLDYANLGRTASEDFAGKNDGSLFSREAGLSSWNILEEPLLFPDFVPASLMSLSDGGSNSKSTTSKDFVESFPEPLSGRWPLEPDTHGDHSQQQPSDEQCNKHSWAYYYFSFAVSRAFQSLYENKWGWADMFASYWQIVANSFRDQPGILGYELINEPWAGDMYHDPLLLVPGVADHRNLAPFYERLQLAIRAVDPDRILFIESITFENVLCGFSSVPGGAQFQNRTVLSYHYYQPPNMKPQQAIRERLRESKKLGCGAMLTEFFVVDPVAKQRRTSWYELRFTSQMDPTVTSEIEQRLEETIGEPDAHTKKSILEIDQRPWIDPKLISGGNMNTLSFIADAYRVVEKLSTRGSSSESKSAESVSTGINPPSLTEEREQMSGTKASGDSVDVVLAEADAHQQSWIGWEYKAFQNKTGSVMEESLFMSDGKVNVVVAKRLARTYPQAVMGSIISYSFDPISSDFHFSYVAGDLQPETSPASREEDYQTQVFVHRPYYYPSGLDISVNHDCIKVQETQRFIFLSHSQACVGLRIYLRISKTLTQSS